MNYNIFLFVFLLLNDNAWSSDRSDDLAEISVDAAESLILIKKSVDKAEESYGHVKKGLVSLRNNKKTISDISKKIGNKRYADKVNGAVRIITKNIARLDSASKKIKSSKIGKISKQLTKGVGKKINIASNTHFLLDKTVKAKELFEKENVELVDINDFAIDVLSYTFVGTIAKEGIYDNLKGIDEQSKLKEGYRESILSDVYESGKSNLNNTNFERRIMNGRSVEVGAVSDAGELQEIFDVVIADEIKDLKYVIKRANRGVDELRSLDAEKEEVDALIGLKNLLELRLEKIESGGEFKNNLKDSFYYLSASIISKKSLNDVGSVAVTLREESESLMAVKNNILSLANKSEASFESTLIGSDKTKSIESYPSVSELKESVVALLAINKENAEAYEKLYVQLKNDPENESLQRRVNAADQSFRESTQKYIEARSEIRKSDADYGDVAYSLNAIKSRIDESFLVANTARVERQNSTLALKAKKDADAIVRKQKEKQLSAMQSESSNLLSIKNQKLSELNGLLSRQRIYSSNQDKVDKQLSDLEFRREAIRKIVVMKASYGFKGLSINDISPQHSRLLKETARKLGVDWRRLYIVADPLFKNAIADLNTFKKSLESSKLAGKLTSSELRRINTLRREISSLERDLYEKSLAQEKLTRELFGANHNSYAGFYEGAAPLNDSYGNVDASDYSSSSNNFDTSELSSQNAISAVSNSTQNLEWLAWGSAIGSSGSTFIHSSLGSENTSSQILSNRRGATALINLEGVSSSIRAISNYGDFSYVSWGTWNGGSARTYTDFSNNTFANVDGHWVYGQLLNANDIPTSGSANYSGQVIGGFVNSATSAVESNSITGNINMSVTFRNGNNSLSGSMGLDRNGSSFATATFNTQNARSASNDPTFSATLIESGGGTGNIKGAFYGDGAAEVGGSFQLSTANGGTAGVFRAKK